MFPRLSTTQKPRSAAVTHALKEMRALSSLALPIAATQVAQMAVSTTDILMLGHLGAPQLAAAAIANTYQFMVWIIAFGPISAVSPIIAQQLGADPTNTRDVRRALRMTLWVAIAMIVPVGIIYGVAPAFLKLLGQSDEVIRLATPYIWSLAPGMTFAMGYLALRNCLAALSFARAPLVIAALLVGINALLGYAMIFGHFGFPKLELIGAGVAASISNAISFFALFAWVLVWPTFRRYQFLANWWKPDWGKLRELFRIGVPIGVTTLFEGTMFQAGVFMMGHLGTIPLAAHQIAMNIASVTFMVPLGLSQAATVRVGLAAGAKNPAQMRFAAFTAIGFGAGFMMLCAIVMAVFSHQLAELYLGPNAADAAAVTHMAAQFLLLAAAFQIFDSSQVTAAGALRGLKDTRMPAILAGIAYWVIGFPVCLWLGLFTPLGGVGIWIGYVFALAAAAILLVGRVVILTRPSRTRVEAPEPEPEFCEAA